MPSVTIPTDELIRRYDAGETFRQIANEYGVSFQALAARYARSGRQARPKAPRKYTPIPCATCGTLFTPKSKRSRFCCSKCIRHKPREAHDVCRRGHLLTPDNLYPAYGNQPPRCRACALENQRRWRERKLRGQSTVGSN